MISTKPASIVLADDHSIVRELIAAICESQDDFRVVGQCGDGLAAVNMIETLRPDLAILDLNMPKLHGLEVIKRVRKVNSRVKLIILSLSRDQNTVQEALRLGADAFLSKNSPARHLLDALHHTLDGGTYISPFIEAAQLYTPRSDMRTDDPIDTLSAREYQVFTMLVEGLHSKEIATLLDISPKTVDTYRAILRRKLNIPDVAGMVKLAVQRNLTSTRTA